MNCDRCLALLNDYLDGELDGNLQEQAKTHLQACPVCHMQFEQANLAKQFIHRKFCLPPAPLGLQNRICRAIRKSSAKKYIRKIFISHRILVEMAVCTVFLAVITGTYPGSSPSS
jgi:anti-sigma factor (TIGR02949 family)